MRKVKNFLKKAAMFVSAFGFGYVTSVGLVTLNPGLILCGLFLGGLTYIQVLAISFENHHFAVVETYSRPMIVA